jgi:hypothetical protein
MERTVFTPAGSSLAALIDQDIAHIGRVMRPSLHGDLGGSILPAPYWRKRLYQLLDIGNLSHAQLCKVDSLLLQLDQFDAELQLASNDLSPAANAPLQPPRHRVAAGGHI